MLIGGVSLSHITLIAPVLKQKKQTGDTKLVLAGCGEKRKFEFLQNYRFKVQCFLSLTLLNSETVFGESEAAFV